MILNSCKAWAEFYNLSELGNIYKCAMFPSPCAKTANTTHKRFHSPLYIYFQLAYQDLHVLKQRERLVPQTTAKFIIEILKIKNIRMPTLELIVSNLVHLIHHLHKTNSS